VAKCMRFHHHSSIQREEVIHLLGDSKWLWINMATLYENLCGNSVGRIDLTFLLQVTVAQF
jgi:hypothetical protein